MSTKTFCDVCSQEIASANSMTQALDAPVAGGYVRLAYYRHVLNNDAKQNTDVCRYCALDAINTLDNRPVAAQG